MTHCDLPDTHASSCDNHNGDLPEGVPPLRTFYVYLSSSCNLRCKHCWIAPDFSGDTPVPGSTVDLSALHKAVVEAKTLGLCGTKLTGGEPMLHPQFLEVVDMLSNEGLSLVMETNGTLLTPDIATHLKNNTRMDFISVSIDSPVPAEHDAFRGVKGAFMRTLAGLDALVDAGYTNCQVIMSVHPGNMSRMEDLIKLVVEHKGASVKFNPIMKTGRGISMHEKGEVFDLEGHLALGKYVNEELRPRSPIPLHLSLPMALTPYKELWRTRGKGCNCGVLGILGILGTGEIALCGIGETIPELIYGWLGKDSIRDIWLSNPVIQKLRQDLADVKNYPGVCGTCVHARTCRTECVANNYSFSGKLVSPQMLCSEAHRLGAFPKSRVR
ncbi:MAG TPA: radical SAM protein [Methanospirillum sp.]|nr:radical SAM protein [Methanospirillum sp.]